MLWYCRCCNQRRRRQQGLLRGGQEVCCCHWEWHSWAALHGEPDQP
jgi:hypothetical protein